MAYESIKVDIIPGAENAEVLHFSQYDNKRPFFIELFNGADEFIPEAGMTITLECRKRDGNIVIISDPVMNDNVAEFSTTEQLTACYGDNMAEIKIVDENDLVIGSANFIINVEKSPTCGGLVSESEIDNLTQQIEEITQEVIGNDYYNKAQTDALLENKADVSDLPDMTNYYTKAQTDDLLDDKADRSELSALASKAELEHAIAEEDTSVKDWVSSHFATPGYVAQRYYNKNQVDELIDNMLPVGSDSGNPCSFDTKIAAELQALTANIVCGGGGGTPSTPIPIVGHTELNLTVNSNTFTVNFGQTVYGGVYDANAGKARITHGIYDLGNVNWYLEQVGGFYRFRASGYAPIPNSKTTGGVDESIICSCFVESSLPSSYNTLDNAICIYNGMPIVRCDAYTDAADFKTAMVGQKVTFTLATPIEIDVSELSVDTIVGVNNIISDCGGDVNVSYKDTIQHYIDSRI